MGTSTFLSSASFSAFVRTRRLKIGGRWFYHRAHLVSPKYFEPVGKRLCRFSTYQSDACGSVSEESFVFLKPLRPAMFHKKQCSSWKMILRSIFTLSFRKNTIKNHCSKSSTVVLSKSGFQVVFKNCSFKNSSKSSFSIIARYRGRPQQIVARDGWRRRFWQLRC